MRLDVIHTGAFQTQADTLYVQVLHLVRPSTGFNTVYHVIRTLISGTRVDLLHCLILKRTPQVNKSQFNSLS